MDGFPNKRKTRLICTLDNQLEFRCGLNHLGDGNFFVILSGKNLKVLGKTVGDSISFQLHEDPDPLGVPMPEVLQVLLDQDESMKNKFDQLTMGKKRNIIFQIARIKDVDKQVSKALSLIDPQ